MRAARIHSRRGTIVCRKTRVSVVCWSCHMPPVDPAGGTGSAARLVRKRHGTKCPRLQCAPRAEPNGEIKSARPARTDTHGLGAQRPQGRPAASTILAALSACMRHRHHGDTYLGALHKLQCTRPRFEHGAACKRTNTDTRIHKRAHQCRARINHTGLYGCCSRWGSASPSGHSPSHTRARAHINAAGTSVAWPVQQPWQPSCVR